MGLRSEEVVVADALAKGCRWCRAAVYSDRRRSGFVCNYPALRPIMSPACLASQSSASF